MRFILLFNLHSMSGKPVYVTIWCLSFTAALLSCKKSSDDKPKTKTEILTAASWKFVNVTVGGTDASGTLEDCEKDNLLEFNANGNGTIDEGPTKCDPDDPQTTSFTWSFTNNETIIHASTPLFPGGSSDFNVITLTETQLVISQDVDVLGTTQNAVITFKK